MYRAEKTSKFSEVSIGTKITKADGDTQFCKAGEDTNVRKILKQFYYQKLLYIQTKLCQKIHLQN